MAHNNENSIPAVLLSVFTPKQVAGIVSWVSRKGSQAVSEVSATRANQYMPNSPFGVVDRANDADTAASLVRAIVLIAHYGKRETHSENDYFNLLQSNFGIHSDLAREIADKIDTPDNAGVIDFIENQIKKGVNVLLPAAWHVEQDRDEDTDIPYEWYQLGVQALELAKRADLSGLPGILSGISFPVGDEGGAATGSESAEDGSTGGNILSDLFGDPFSEVGDPLSGDQEEANARTMQNLDNFMSLDYGDAEDQGGWFSKLKKKAKKLLKKVAKSPLVKSIASVIPGGSLALEAASALMPGDSPKSAGAAKAAPIKSAQQALSVATNQAAKVLAADEATSANTPVVTGGHGDKTWTVKEL